MRERLDMTEDSELERNMASLEEDGEEELLGAKDRAARERVLGEFERYVSSMERYRRSSSLHRWAALLTFLTLLISAVEVVFFFIMGEARGRADLTGYVIFLGWTALTAFFLMKSRASWREYKEVKKEERRETRARRAVLQTLREKAAVLDREERERKHLERSW